MILSHEYRFIFVKTWKVGGTSLEIALSKFLGEDDVITPISPKDEKARKALGFRTAQNFRYRISEWPPLKALDFAKDAGEYLFDRERFWIKKGKLLIPPHYKYWNHMSAQQIRARVSPKVWNEYFKFTIERNPWDFVVSLYFWRKKAGLKIPDFRSFLEAGNAGLLRNFDLYSANGCIEVDKVIFFETLGEGLDEISTRIGLPEELSALIGRIYAKPSAKRDYREFYDEATQELVRRKYADVVSHFGYTF
jgi:hypothetical protein